MAANKYEKYAPQSDLASRSEKKVPFAVVEAYKTARTNLTFVLSAENNNVVTFSSPEVSDGKSTTSVNVAIAFSQLGKKILLVDCDLRRSSLHKKLKVENKTGLSNVLVELDTFDNAVQHINSSLDLLTAGQIPPNPSELLDSQAFAELVKWASNEYAYVILDTPPLNVVSDALIVSKNSAGIVLVVRENYTTTDAVQRAMTAAEFGNIKILGTVINAIDGKGIKKGYYRYRYRYGRKYSYSYSNKPTVPATPRNETTK